MPRYKATSPATGDVITFEWDGDKPPTRTDILRMEADMLNQESENVPPPPPKPGFFEQVGQNLKGLIDYRPDKAIPELGAGISQMISGEGEEQYPRLAGMNKAARGLFGTIGTPLALAGAAMAPVPTAMALGSIALGSPLIRGGVEATIPQAPDEVKESIELGGTTVLGGAAAKLGHRGTPAPKPKAAPTETGVSTWVRRPRPQDPVTPESEIIDLGPRALPPGGPEGSYVVEPQLSGRPIGLLPPPSRVFHMPEAEPPPPPPPLPRPPVFSFDPGAVVPSYTLGEGNQVVPNKPSLQDLLHENRVVEPLAPEPTVEEFWQNAPTTRAEQQLDYNTLFNAEAPPPVKAPVAPPITVPKPAPVMPPVKPVEAVAPQPTAAPPVEVPTEVLTDPEGFTRRVPVKTEVDAEFTVPPEETIAPKPEVKVEQPTPPIEPPKRSAPEQKGQAVEDVVSQALSVKPPQEAAPTKLVEAPPAAPLPSAQLPAVAAPEGPQKPPAPTPKPGSVDDIVGQALGPVKPPVRNISEQQSQEPIPVKLPTTIKQPTPKPQPKTVQITREQVNKALEFLKVRKSVTPADLQEKLGLTEDQARGVLGDFIRRGLATQKGKSVNYKEAVDLTNRETEVTPPTPPSTEPKLGPVKPPVPTTPTEATPPKVNPPEGTTPPEKPTITAPLEKAAIPDERLEGIKKNIKLMKDQIKSYEAKGLDDAAKKKRAALKKYLKTTGVTEEELFGSKTEVKNAKPKEPKDTSKSKTAKLSDEEKRDINTRIDELESIEGERALTSEERAEYRELNKKITGLERFWSDESGEFRPRALGEKLKKIAESLSRRGPEKGTFRKNYVTSGERVLEIEGKAADKLREDLFHSRTAGGVFAGKMTVRYTDAIKGMSKEDHILMAHVLQGRASIDNVPPHVAKAVKVTRQILNEVHTHAVAVGVEETLPNGQKITTRYRTDYWPMKFEPDFWEKSGKTRKSLAQRLVDSGEVETLAEAEKFIEDIIEPQSENIMGHLQRPRRFNIQDFSRTDKSVIPEYLEEAGRKIAEVEEFGPKASKMSYPEGVADALDNIRREGGDYQTSAEVAKAYLGRSPLSHMESKLWQKFSSFEVATKLGIAVISNMSQPVYISLITGMRTFAKAVAEVILHPERSERFALESGSTLPGVIHQLQHEAGLTSRNAGAKVLKIQGFMKAEMKNRTIASISGMHHAVRMAKKLIKDPESDYVRRQLHKWLGLDPDKILSQKGLTRDDLLTAAKTMSDRTQGRSTPLDLPWTWNQNLPMKVMTLFKSFAFNQAKLMKQAVWREVKRGNYRPLIPLFTLVPIVGTIVDRIKRFVSRREQPNGFWDTLIGAYTAPGAFGIVMDMISRATYGQLATSLAGVGFSDAGAVGEAAVKVSPKPLKRVAGPVGRALFPADKKKSGHGGIGAVGPVR